MISLEEKEEEERGRGERKEKERERRGEEEERRGRLRKGTVEGKHPRGLSIERDAAIVVQLEEYHSRKRGA